MEHRENAPESPQSPITEETLRQLEGFRMKNNTSMTGTYKQFMLQYMTATQQIKFPGVFPCRYKEHVMQSLANDLEQQNGPLEAVDFFRDPSKRNTPEVVDFFRQISSSQEIDTKRAGLRGAIPVVPDSLSTAGSSQDFSRTPETPPQGSLEKRLYSLKEAVGLNNWGIDFFLLQIKKRLGLNHSDPLDIHSESIFDANMAIAIAEAFSMELGQVVPASSSDREAQEVFGRLQSFIRKFVVEEYKSSLQGAKDIIHLMRSGISILALLEPIQKLSKNDLIKLFTSPEEKHEQAKVYSQLSTELKANPEIIDTVLRNDVFRGNLPENCFSDFNYNQARIFLEKAKSINGSFFSFIEDFPHLHSDQEFRGYCLRECPPYPELFDSDNMKSCRIDIPEYKDAFLRNLLGDAFDPKMEKEKRDFLTEMNRILHESPQIHDYSFALKNETTLAINPKDPTRTSMNFEEAECGLGAVLSRKGGYNFIPLQNNDEKNEFTFLGWETVDVAKLLGQEDISRLHMNEYKNLNRTVLKWETSDGDSGLLFLASLDLGVVLVHKGEIAILNIENVTKWR